MSPLHQSITVRPAYADDATAIRRLAALDSSPVPASPMLLAEVDGELRAALSLADGCSIADPFHPSLGLVDLLRLHATSAGRPGARRRERRRVSLRFA
jgi:hypothetical protein